MIYLLSGPETFLSSAKLNGIKAKFLASNDLANLQVIHGNDLAKQDLNQLFYEQTLMPGKRLVIMTDVLSQATDAGKQALVEQLEHIPDNVVVVFHESQEFDARQVLFKRLVKFGQHQAFTALSPVQLAKEVGQMIETSQLKIAPGQISALIDRVGPDLWQLSSEINKLAAFAQGRSITTEEIEGLVPPRDDYQSFALVDAVLNRDLATANRTLAAMLRQGESEIKLLGSLAYQLRALARVDGLTKQALSPAQIAVATGLHPFVVKKMAAALRQITPAQIEAAYQALLATDLQIKTGAAAPDDALDCLIAKLA